MKIVIVRHGDPDYSIDSLTEKGWKEAELLAPRIAKLDVKDFYVSPMGRAKDTAKPTLRLMNRTATECEWLREFSAVITHPTTQEKVAICWDWVPGDWVEDPVFYDRDKWHTHPVMAEGDVKKEYDWVIKSFDDLLAKYGYVREGNHYIHRGAQRRHSRLPRTKPW